MYVQGWTVEIVTNSTAMQSFLELCNTIDTTQYRNTKQYRSTSSFGIVGIDYATYNQTGDDFGSHFQLIWIKLVG